MSNPNNSSKEISPGIFLYTKQNPGQNGLGTFLFEAEVKKPNLLEFTIDLTGSQNVSIEGASGLTNTVAISPYTRKIIAKVVLKKNWNLKTKFSYILKPPPPELLAKMMVEEHEQMQNDFNASKELLHRFPAPILPVPAVIQILEQQGIKFHDIDFEPSNDIVFGSIMDPSSVENVHWRRAKDFLIPEDGSGVPAVFSEKIEPSDIKQGALGDCWFMSALACMAERSELIERLFITKEWNSQGIYRVRLCKNGEWVMVTVDDFFPCQPMSGPMFSRSNGSELWVLLLEKAYAKLHGCYYLLRGGFANEALIDLTGCPSESFYFDEEDVQKMIQDGSLWKRCKRADDLGYLLCGSTPGEDMWTMQGKPIEGSGGLVSGHAYSIIQVKEYKQHKLLNMRNPWGNFEWEGDWGDNSPLWTDEAKRTLNPTLGVDDGTFWITWKDFLTFFKCINICKVRPWHEVRIKGIFVRAQNVENPDNEAVLSKWYYSFDVQQKTKLIIGLHQEDVRIAGVISRRPLIDLGFIVMKKNPDGSLTHAFSRNLVTDRQAELEMDLEPGSYIVLPRTTGCTLRRPPEAKPENIRMMNEDGKLHELVESTINDIFRKFDVIMNRELSYTEFRGFLECIGRTMTQKDFKTQVLDRYASTETGLTSRGFVGFFKDAITQMGEETVWKWFKRFGYDKDLYSIRSRCFTITFHSDYEINVGVRDAIQTDLDNRANILLLQKYGVPMEVGRGIRALSVFHKEASAYSYGVINDQKFPIECTLDFSDSTNMLFSTKTPIVKKRIEPGALEFMVHSEGNPAAQEYTRALKSLWSPINE